MTHKEEAPKPTTRQEKRNSAPEQEDKAQDRKKWLRWNRNRTKNRVRLVPIWARLLITVALLVISLLAGLLVGYALIGEGDSFRILRLETWQRLIDFVNGN